MEILCNCVHAKMWWRYGTIVVLQITRNMPPPPPPPPPWEITTWFWNEHYKQRVHILGTIVQCTLLLAVINDYIHTYICNKTDPIEENQW